MKEKTKKTLYIVLITVAVCVIGVAAYFAVNYFPGLKIGKELSNLLQPVLNAENQSMHIDLAADINGELMNIDADLIAVTEDATKYYVFEQGEHPIYIVDGVLYFENANAYKIADNMSDGLSENDNLFLQIAALYEVVEIQKTENGSEIEYAMSVTGAEVQEILSSVMATQEAAFTAIQTLDIKLTAKDETLQSIEISGRAEDVMNTTVSISIVLSDFQMLEEGDYTIPENIKNAVANVDKDSLFSITEDLYPLVVALNNFSSKESLDGRVELYASCGVINFHNTYNLSSLEGNLSNSEEIEGMPSLIGFLCLEGEISCTNEENKYVYELALDEEAMQTLAETIAPEIVNQVVDLTNGKASLTVENETITSIEVDIDGKIKVLFTEVEAQVGAEFTFE